MKYIRGLLILAVLAAVAIVATMRASAQAPKFQQDIVVQGKAMPGSTTDLFLTFSGPFTVPGVTLSQGTYVFRSPSPGVLQVLSADRRATYAMAFTTPVERGVVTDEPEVTFGEFVGDSPRKIIALWRSNAVNGQQLIYPDK